MSAVGHASKWQIVQFSAVLLSMSTFLCESVISMRSCKLNKHSLPGMGGPVKRTTPREWTACLGEGPYAFAQVGMHDNLDDNQEHGQCMVCMLSVMCEDKGHDCIECACGAPCEASSAHRRMLLEL